MMSDLVMLLLKQHSVFSRQLISRQAIFQSCMLKANGFLASIGAVIYTDFGPLCKFLESNVGTDKGVARQLPHRAFQLQGQEQPGDIGRGQAGPGNQVVDVQRIRREQGMDHRFSLSQLGLCTSLSWRTALQALTKGGVDLWQQLVDHICDVLDQLRPLLD
jgi:hypothetical protein